ncbi:hypothetical protein M758_UG308400 [Ceratodon purpureus]|nr:hypothetical protein M758_UG308400 [Ceratodon purpureus]
MIFVMVVVVILVLVLFKLLQHQVSVDEWLCLFVRAVVLHIIISITLLLSRLIDEYKLLSGVGDNFIGLCRTSIMDSNCCCQWLDLLLSFVWAVAKLLSIVGDKLVKVVKEVIAERQEHRLEVPLELPEGANMVCGVEERRRSSPASGGSSYDCFQCCLERTVRRKSRVDIKLRLGVRSSKVYVVRQGMKTGIFRIWEDCNAEVLRYSGAQFKSFKSVEEAEVYLES